MFTRIAKFSFATFQFVLDIPFQILAIVACALNALAAAAIGGFIMALVMQSIEFPCELGYVWGLVIFLSVFSTMLYRHFVLGKDKGS